MQSASCSGKLTVFARLLVESGVISREECTPEWTALCAVAEGGADVAGEVQLPVSDDSDSSEGSGDNGDDDEEDAEEEEEEEEEEKEKEKQKEEQQVARRDKTSSAKSSRKRALELKEDLVQHKRQSRSGARPAAPTTLPIPTPKSTTINKKQPEDTDAKAKKRVIADKAIPALAVAPRRRCLVFAQHRAVLDIVETCILRPCFPTVRYARLDGSVDPTTRGRLAQEFNAQKDRGNSGSGGGGEGEGEGSRILLLTARACGLGLNLTAADTVIFLEHDWNPFVDLQAMDRAHRLGQTKQVTVYRLLAEATIEARIMCTQELKTKVADEVITAANAGGSDAPALGAALWSSVGVSINANHVSGTAAAAAAAVGAGGWSAEEYESLDLDSFLADIGIEPE